MEYQVDSVTLINIEDGEYIHKQETYILGKNTAMSLGYCECKGCDVFMNGKHRIRG